MLICHYQSRLKYCVIFTENDRGILKCRISEVPANGRVFPSLGITVNVGKRVMFKCRAGYKLVGKSQTTCVAGNRLRDAVPRCKRG